MREECGQQIERVSPPALLCSSQATFGVLGPILSYSDQDGQGTTREVQWRATDLMRG